MQLQDDNHYVAKILAGDPKSFAVLVDRYKDFVFHIAFKIVKNREEAEEVAQDSFLKAYKKLGTFSQQSKFSSWLYKICYYTAISKTRNKFNEVHVFGSEESNRAAGPEGPDGLNKLSREEQKKYIDIALQQLPEQVQLILTLFYLKECSLKEIADITGISPANIKSILHRGRKKMHQTLKELLKNEVNSII